MALRKITLIAAASLGALASLGVQAQTAAPGSSVTIWGVVDAFAGRQQLSGRDATTVVGSGGLTTSRVAFLGSEDLGGGLRANFNLQMFLRPDSGDLGRFPGDVAFAGRSTVGLNGNFGEFNMGRMNSPLFFTLMRQDVFGLAALGPMFQHMFPGGQPIAAPQAVTDSTINNGLQYATPNFGGFRGAVHYGMSETVPHKGRSGYSLSYINQGLDVAIAGDHIKAGPLVAGESKQTSQLISASYDFGGFKLVGIAQRQKQEVLRNTYKIYNLGASIPVNGVHKVLVSYSHTDLNAVVGDRTRKTLALSYNHYLSKRTDLYVLASSDKVSNLDRGTTLVGGIRHRF